MRGNFRQPALYWQLLLTVHFIHEEGYIMKKITAIVPLMLFMVVSTLCAQRNYPVSVGPFLTLKAGVNAASIPTGRKTGVALSGLPDFGVTGYLPLGEKSNIGILADIGYSTYAYGQRNVFGDIESDLYKVQMSYLTLAPSFYLSGFYIGFDFGLPLSNSVVIDGKSISGSTDNMSTLVELHIGGMIPVMSDKSGRLNLIIRGGYMLTGTASNSDSEFNPKAATAGIGLNYLFNIGRR